MWELHSPNPVKLIIGILAADKDSLQAGVDSIVAEFGPSDLTSDIWPFDMTDYYKDQTGEHILKQFVSIDKLIAPGLLADIKHRTNDIEKRLAADLEHNLPRPVNLDPGIIEPSKLVLASTKNYYHRIYIGRQMYAEVTLYFHQGKWKDFDYTYPDYKQPDYHRFFTRVRNKLLEQLKRVN